MSHPEPQPVAFDVIFENILDFLLPFFLAAAGGDRDLARLSIRTMAEPYNATTVTELELVGRILGFNVVAMDNLRLSMNPEMSDTKILRYRSNAVALSRAGEQCRTILEVLQGLRRAAVTVTPPPVPEPRIEPAPPAAQRPVPSRQASPAGPVSFGGLPAGFLSDAPKDIESMKRDARILMAAFAKGGSRPGSALTTVPKAGDPVAMVDAAVRQAFAQSGIKGSGVRR